MTAEETRGYRTLTAATLRAAERRTFYFVGVTTGESSIRRVFPLWAEALGLDDVELVGVDLPLHAPAEDYRRVVTFLRDDPLSLGALVTTHKIDLFAAAHDLFGEIDDLAALMHEVSSISKRGDVLRAHAKDPITAGLAIDAIVPAGWFAETGAEALVYGAGGAAVAIDWFLTRPDRADRPARVVVADLSRERLEHLRSIHERSGAATELSTVVVDAPATAERLLAASPPGTLVVNATGLGKDGPGAPIPPGASFPERAVVWELNYRGDLLFLDWARRQSADRSLLVADGWNYFVHGWTSVIAEVFDIDIPTSGPEFDRLSAIAAGARSAS